MLPRISIVTPSYNQGVFLEETIKSVISQNYPNLEYIIIDGGSTDNSVGIITKYAAHLTHWVSEKDRGFGDAINKGFARSTGEILCWLNSDDLLLPGALLTVGKYFHQYKRTGLVFGDRHIVDIQSKLRYKRDYFFYFPGQFKYAKALPQEATFWRRGCFEKAGPLDEQLKYAIDFDLWCRISAVGTIRHIPFYLGAFREQPASKSATLSQTGLEERRKIIVKYFNTYPSTTKLKVFQFMLGTLRRLYRLLFLPYFKRVVISMRISKDN